jgi:hypothetical protein
VGEERTREDADAGVERCMHMMLAGEWQPGTSHKLVAEEFGVSPVTVKNWATNASRIIRLCPDEETREEIRLSMLTTLSRVVQEGFDRKVVVMPRHRDGSPEYVDSPDLKAVVAAIDTQAKLLGLVVQKHDVRTRPAVAHLSRDEHRAELEKLQSEIAAEVARLATEGGT